MVDKETGVVRVGRVMSAEMVSIVEIVIRASDRGAPQQSTNITLVVHIVDAVGPSVNCEFIH